MRSVSFCATSRPVKSEPPPGAKGTMTRTGFAGYCWATAGSEAAATTAASNVAQNLNDIATSSSYCPIIMSQADASRDVNETFLRAEQSGLKLAIIGRTVALVLLGVWLVGSRARDPARALDYLMLLSGFAALGLAHYFLIGTRFDKRWVKYVFITFDIAILSALVATQPLYESAAELPQVMLFRVPLFQYYFVILGVAAFSFSPGLVLWSGIAGALGWLGAFLYAAGGVDGSVNWRAIPPNPTAEQVRAVVLDPNFGGISGRLQEV